MNVGSIGVSTGPGAMTLARMSGACMSAMDFANTTSPPLVIEYSGLSGEPTTPEVEAVKMIEPPPLAFITGTAYEVRKNALRRLMSTVRWKSSTVMSRPAGPGDARVVEEHVDAAQLGRREVHQGAQLLDVGHVDREGAPRAARRVDLLGHALRRRGVDVRHDHRRARPRQPQAARPPHARAAGGDDGDLALQAHRALPSRQTIITMTIVYRDSACAYREGSK